MLTWDSIRTHKSKCSAFLSVTRSKLRRKRVIYIIEGARNKTPSHYLVHYPYLKQGNCFDQRGVEHGPFLTCKDLAPIVFSSSLGYSQPKPQTPQDPRFLLLPVTRQGLEQRRWWTKPHWQRKTMSHSNVMISIGAAGGRDGFCQHPLMSLCANTPKQNPLRKTRSIPQKHKKSVWGFSYMQRLHTEHLGFSGFAPVMNSHQASPPSASRVTQQPAILFMSCLLGALSIPGK